MSHAQDNTTLKTYLDSFEQAIEDGNPADVLAFLRVLRMNGLDDDVSTKLVEAFSETPEDDDFARARQWARRKQAQLAPDSDPSHTPAAAHTTFTNEDEKTRQFDDDMHTALSNAASVAGGREPSEASEAFFDDSSDALNVHERPTKRQFQAPDTGSPDPLPSSAQPPATAESFDSDTGTTDSSEHGFSFDRIPTSDNIKLSDEKEEKLRDSTFSKPDTGTGLEVEPQPPSEQQPPTDDDFDFVFNTADSGNDGRRRDSTSSQTAANVGNEGDSQPPSNEQSTTDGDFDFEFEAASDDANPSAFGGDEFEREFDSDLEADVDNAGDSLDDDFDFDDDFDDDFEFDLEVDSDNAGDSLDDDFDFDDDFDDDFEFDIEVGSDNAGDSLDDAFDFGDDFDSDLETDSDNTDDSLDDAFDFGDDFDSDLETDSDNTDDSLDDAFDFGDDFDTDLDADSDNAGDTEDDDFDFGPDSSTSPPPGDDASPSEESSEFIDDNIGYAAPPDDDFFPPPVGNDSEESAAPTPESPRPGRPQFKTPLFDRSDADSLREMSNEPSSAKPSDETSAQSAGSEPSAGSDRTPLSEEEFLTLGNELSSSQSSTDSNTPLGKPAPPSPSESSQSYRGEPLVSNVGDESTPARDSSVPAESNPQSRELTDEPTGSFANPDNQTNPTPAGTFSGVAGADDTNRSPDHATPAGGVKPLAASSSFVLEEVGDPKSSVNDPADVIAAAIDQARVLYEQGEFDEAMELVEAVFDIDEDCDKARELQRLLEGELERAEINRLGSLARTPSLNVAMGEIAGLDLDHRAGFLISQIDGMLTFNDILDMSSMSRLETLEILNDLNNRGIIDID